MTFATIRHKLLQKFLKMPVRDFVIYLVTFIALIFFTVHLFQITDKASLIIEKNLSDMGFKKTHISKIEKNIGGFTATNISLDDYNLDTIKTVQIKINWFKFLFGGKITSIHIDDLYITRDLKKSPFSIEKIITLLQKQRTKRIDFTNINYNVITNFGDLRFMGDVSIDSKDNGYGIKALLDSTQKQMSFRTSWQGEILNDKTFDIFGEILDGRINLGDLRISRVNGWSSLSNTQDGIKAQLSMNAGSAFLKKLPLQNLVLNSELYNNTYAISLRSGISGFPATIATFDFGKQDGALNSLISFKSDNFSDVINTIQAKTLKKNPKGAIKKFKIKATLKPELQFKGGPMPYAITMGINNSNSTTGNILFYRDTGDARGILEMDNQNAKILKEIFNFSNENMSDENIRLDGNLKEILNFK